MPLLAFLLDAPCFLPGRFGNPRLVAPAPPFLALLPIRLPVAEALALAAAVVLRLPERRIGLGLPHDSGDDAGGQ